MLIRLHVGIASRYVFTSCASVPWCGCSARESVGRVAKFYKVVSAK